MWIRKRSSIVQPRKPRHVSICHVHIPDQGLRTLWVHSTMKTGNKNSQPVAMGPCCTQPCWTVRDAHVEKSGRVGLWVGQRRREGDCKKREQHHWPPRELDCVLEMWPAALLFVSVPNHKTSRSRPFVSCRLQAAVIRQLPGYRTHYLLTRLTNYF